MGKLALWIGAIACAVAVGTVGASLISQGGGTSPDERELDEIAQATSAADVGVELTALGAVFSGTESVVRLAIATVDESLLSEAVSGREIVSVTLAPDGIEGPFSGYTVDVVPVDGAEVLAEIPPMIVADDYDGTVDLVLRALVVRTTDGPVRIAGEWPLELSGPAPDVVRDVLWRQDFRGTAIPAAPGNVLVSGTASASETRVQVSLPDGVIILGQPRLHFDGQVLSPFAQETDADGVEIHFPPTGRSMSMTLELGELGVAASGTATSVTINIAQAVERVPNPDDGEFAIDADDIVAGRGDLVLAGGLGQYQGRDWVNIRLEGNWHPVPSASPTVGFAEDSPQAFNADGERLSLAHVQTGYSQSSEGEVRSGVTDIAVFAELDDLESLTLVLGSPTVIQSRPNQSKLTPIE